MYMGMILGCSSPLIVTECTPHVYGDDSEFMLFQYCLDSESLKNAKYMLKDYKEK